jgi:hypothetical protein
MSTRAAKETAIAEQKLAGMPAFVLSSNAKDAIQKAALRAIPQFDAVKKVADAYGIDPYELLAYHVAETRGSEAMGGTSPRGATGPFQIMPDNRKAFAPTQGTLEFEKDADVAAQVARDMQKRNLYSSPMARAAAYNLGEGKFRLWGGQPGKLNAQTSEYIALHQEAMRALKEARKARKLDLFNAGEAEATKHAVPTGGWVSGTSVDAAVDERASARDAARATRQAAMADADKRYTTQYR